MVERERYLQGHTNEKGEIGKRLKKRWKLRYNEGERWMLHRCLRSHTHDTLNKNKNDTHEKKTEKEEYKQTDNEGKRWMLQTGLRSHTQMML